MDFAADFPGKIYGNKCVWDELWAARGRRANLWTAPSEFFRFYQGSGSETQKKSIPDPDLTVKKKEIRI